MLLCLTLSHLLGTTCLLFGLTLGHFLCPLCSLLLSTHLLFFSGTTGLLLRALHFSLLLAAGLLFSLALGHFLRPLRCLLLGAHLLLFSGAAGLLLRALHFSLLLTTHLLFRLALSHFLRPLRSFLLGTHLLLFSGTACDFLLLALLHGYSFSLLANAFSFDDGSLFSSHALSRGTLLLGGHVLLLLRSGGLLARFFSLGGSLFSDHALLLGGLRLLLRSGGLHSVFFRFGIRCSLLSSPFFCHASFLQTLLLALLHGCGTGLLPVSTHLNSLSFGRCSGGHLVSRHFLCGNWLLCSAGVSRRLWHDCGWSGHHGRGGPFRLTDWHDCGSRRFSGLVHDHAWHIRGCCWRYDRNAALNDLALRRHFRRARRSLRGTFLIPRFPGCSRIGLRSDGRTHGLLSRSVRHRWHAGGNWGINCMTRKWVRHVPLPRPVLPRRCNDLSRCLIFRSAGRTHGFLLRSVRHSWLTIHDSRGFARRLASLMRHMPICRRLLDLCSLFLPSKGLTNLRGDALRDAVKPARPYWALNVFFNVGATYMGSGGHGGKFNHGHGRGGVPAPVMLRVRRHLLGVHRLHLALWYRAAAGLLDLRAGRSSMMSKSMTLASAGNDLRHIHAVLEDRGLPRHRRIDIDVTRTHKLVRVDEGVAVWPEAVA